MIWFGKSFIKFCKSFINLIKLVSTGTCSSARVRQSSTFHPPPSTLHPPPSTLYPPPSTPTSQILKNQPSTLKHQTSTLNPQPSTLTNQQLSTIIISHQPSTLNPQPLKINTQPSNLYPQHSTLIPHSFFTQPAPQGRPSRFSSHSKGTSLPHPIMGGGSGLQCSMVLGPVTEHSLASHREAGE